MIMLLSCGDGACEGNGLQGVGCLTLAGAFATVERALRWSCPARPGDGRCPTVCAMSDQEQAGQAGAGARPGSLRVSHEDRDQAAESLRIAAGDGRLTAEELDERLESALTARTYDDLASLVADLPAAGTALAP